MNLERLDPRVHLLCAWAGPALTVIFFIGFVLMADFLPPPHPADSAEQIATMYRENTDGIRFGAFTMLLAMGLIAPWGVSIAVWTRRSEAGFPLLTYTQLVCIAVGTMIAIAFTVIWSVAAFRPDDISPEITRMLNDFGWIVFLFEWPPFSIWCVAVALGILWNPGGFQAYPRWAAYLSLWTAFLFIPAGLVIFFKTGAFAFNGLLAMYIPLFIFFIWVIAMSVLTIQAIKRWQREQQVAGDGGAPRAATTPSVGVGT